MGDLELVIFHDWLEQEPVERIQNSKTATDIEFFYFVLR